MRDRMELLYFFEGLRNPVLDAFFALITHLGEETLFIIAGLLFFWCIDKLEGYYLLTVGLTGTVINQFLKLLFRVPRPWVKDENFTIVESARAEATGYSFPSGHTQSAVGIFASVAHWHRQKLVRAVCIVLCVLVPLSRMYLGVHTPADVGVSIVIALVLIFGLYPIIGKVLERPKYMRCFFCVLIVIAIAFLAFVSLYPFPADIDIHNYESGVKNAYKILGCIVGLWLSYEIDIHYTNFETKGIWWVQILKLVPGLLILLAIKSGLKEPLYALLNGSFIADGIRYFLITAVAGGVWPMTFKLWNKLDKKAKK